MKQFLYRKKEIKEPNKLVRLNSKGNKKKTEKEMVSINPSEDCLMYVYNIYVVEINILHFQFKRKRYDFYM